MGTMTSRTGLWSVLRAVGLLGLLCSMPSIALADPKDDARRHFKAGLEAAQQGEYEVALQRFLAAQEAYSHPATLFNIAKAYSDLGDFENALIYYQQFQEESPERAAEVEPMITVLQTRLGEQNRPATPASPASAPSGQAVVVVGGPTQQELDELQALADAVSALQESFAARKQEAEQAVAATPVTVPPSGTPTEGSETVSPVDPSVELPELEGGPDAGFLTGAYDKIVVSAARYSQDPLDSPSTLAVMTAEDIRMMGVTRMSELLRRVAGVDVYEAAVGKPEIAIRGFVDELANKVLILIDGRSTYNDVLGTTFEELFPIVLEEVERVEIIRGPGSAVYGANAVTGVVNIITRTPGEGKSILSYQTGSQGDDPLAFGGYYRGAAVATGRVGTTAYRLSAGYRAAGRWSKDFNDNQYEYFKTFQDDQDRGLQSIRFNGRVDQSVLNGEGLLTMQGGYASMNSEILNQGVLNYYGVDMTRNYLRTDFSYGAFHARAFWNHDQLVNVGPWEQPADQRIDPSGDGSSDVVDIEVEAYEDFQTGPLKHRLNGGLGYRYKRGAKFFFFGPDRPVYTENHFSGFLQDEISLDRSKLLLSFRYDRDPNIDPLKTFSPRASFIYRVADQTSIRVNGGTAFRAPNMIENYLYLGYPTELPGVGIQYGLGPRGDKLLPERIVTAEVGMHDQSTLYHELDVAVYYQYLTNRVENSTALVTLNGYDEDYGAYLVALGDYVNRPYGFHTYGGEVDLSVFPVDGLDLFTNISFQQAFQENELTGDIEPQEDRNYSTLKINTGAMYRAPFRMDFSADIGYASNQNWSIAFIARGDVLLQDFPLPYRLQVNAKIAGRPFADEKLELGLIGWNLAGFARPVREHGEGQPVGGRLLGTVSYKF